MSTVPTPGVNGQSAQHQKSFRQGANNVGRNKGSQTAFNINDERIAAAVDPKSFNAPGAHLKEIVYKK